MIYPHNSMAIQSEWFSSFGIHSINDVQLLRKHYVTRHGFKGVCKVLTPSNLFEKHPSLAVIVET